MHRLSWQTGIIFIGLVALVLGVISIFSPVVTRAEDLPVEHVSGSLLSDQTWTSDKVYIVDSAFYVLEDVTLTIEPGTIVKSSGAIVVRGTLNVPGTAMDPVIFTSLADDSAGGDSNGDGASAGQINDFLVSLRSVYGSDTNIENAIFKYGDSAIGGGEPSNNYCSSGAITVTDSTFNSGISFSGCGSYQPLILKRNTFNMSHEPAIRAGNVDPTAIDLSGTDSNTFAGSGIGRTIEFTTGTGGANEIPLNSTWSVSGSSGAIITLQGRLEVSGTLQLENGAIVKTYYDLKIKNSGMLDVEGSISPVIFTSLADDSAGGDSNGDGASSGSAGNYDTAIRLEGGDARLDGVLIRFGSNGIIATGDAVAIVRGAIQDVSNRGIQACDWAQNCSVDAAYVDWGSSAGPFVAATDLVCGAVTVNPWVVGSSTDAGTMFGVENCNPNDSTPSEQLSQSASYAHQAIAAKRIDCDNGFQDACDAIDTYLACYGSALQLAASQSPIPVTFSNPTETVDTVASTAADAADTYIQGLESQSVGSFNLSVATGMLNVVNLYSALENAYDGCRP